MPMTLLLVSRFLFHSHTRTHISVSLLSRFFSSLSASRFVLFSLHLLVFRATPPSASYTDTRIPRTNISLSVFSLCVIIDTHAVWWEGRAKERKKQTNKTVYVSHTPKKEKYFLSLSSFSSHSRFICGYFSLSSSLHRPTKYCPYWYRVCAFSFLHTRQFVDTSVNE